MPTVLRVDGFRVMIFTNDHEPIHVHVFHGDGEIIITLEDLGVRDNRGMNLRLARRAQEIVADNQAFLIAEWNRIGPIP